MGCLACPVGLCRSLACRCPEANDLAKHRPNTGQTPALRCLTASLSDVLPDLSCQITWWQGSRPIVRPSGQRPDEPAGHPLVQMLYLGHLLTQCRPLGRGAPRNVQPGRPLRLRKPMLTVSWLSNGYPDTALGGRRRRLATPSQWDYVRSRTPTCILIDAEKDTGRETRVRSRVPLAFPVSEARGRSVVNCTVPATEASSFGQCALRAAGL